MHCFQFSAEGKRRKGGGGRIFAVVPARLLKAGYDLRAGHRAGGYVRLFLESADPADGALFARCLREALGPIESPRYVIPRYVDDVHDTWLSHILPDVVGRYFRKRKRRMARLHTVPSPLARTKDLAALYARHWNVHVSPGRPVYAHRAPGRQLIQQARRAPHRPQPTVREKEIFR